MGLSYHTGIEYEDELSEWLDTDLCLIQRLWPTRTVLNEKSVDYVGSAGSLVRANNRKICNTWGAPSTASQPILPICEEIADASDAQMDQWVSQIEDNIVEAVNDPNLNQRIVAWYLGPEELREWVPREKELLQRIYHTVKELDPLNRPALLYIPGHYNTNNLLDLAPWTDSFSMGIYPHLSNQVHNRIYLRHALEQMTAANTLLKQKSSDKEKIIQPVLEMFESNEFTYIEEDAALIQEFVRHDTYAAFANGADGVLIWSMGFRSGFTNYGVYYDAWAEIADQLTNQGLKNVFQYGQVQNKATATVTEGQNKIVFNSLGVNETYPSLSVRDWFFQGRTYVLIVNSSEGDVGFRLKNIPFSSYQDVFSHEKYSAKQGYIDLMLKPRGVILLVSQSNPPWKTKGLNSIEVNYSVPFSKKVV